MGNLNIYNRVYKDYTKNGSCSGCSRCCSGSIPLIPEDVERLKALVIKRGIKPNKRVSTNAVQDVCPFLSEEKECTIYEDRPPHMQVVLLFKRRYR